MQVIKIGKVILAVLFILNFKMSLFSASFGELSQAFIECDRNVDLLSAFIKSKNSVLTSAEIEFVKRAIQKRFVSLFNIEWKKKYKRLLMDDQWCASMFCLKYCVYKFIDKFLVFLKHFEENYYY